MVLGRHAEQCRYRMPSLRFDPPQSRLVKCLCLQRHYLTVFGPSWSALEHELAHTLHTSMQGYWARWKATHQAGFTLPSPQVLSGIAVVAHSLKNVHIQQHIAASWH